MCLNRDLFLSCALYVPFMCLAVSRLFWVLSLAYPNLLGTKGYVVVVVDLDLSPIHIRVRKIRVYR
jgi:hypothetical protein